MKKILSIFGLVLCVCSSGTLTSAGISCGLGMQCARPNLCENYSYGVSHVDYRHNDHSACQYNERCCVLKRNVEEPERPSFTDQPQRKRLLCSGNRNCCVPKHMCINGVIRNVVNHPSPGPAVECSWDQVCCSIEKQPAQSPQPAVHTNEVKPNNCGYSYPNGYAGRGLARFDEFPWVVKIFEKVLTDTSFELFSLSVGSLVSPKAVLTTAYKVFNISETDLIVRGGVWDTRITERAPHLDRRVKRMIFHDEFVSFSSYFDIAILILKDKFELNSHINTICLPQPNMNFDNSLCFVAGWGKRQMTEEADSPILKKIGVRVLDRDTCREKMRVSLNHPLFELHSSLTCAGGITGNTCSGDIGAPLMCPVMGTNRYELAGFLAFNSGCNDRDAPGAYVDVALLRTWILRNIREHSFQP